MMNHIIPFINSGADLELVNRDLPDGLARVELSKLDSLGASYSGRLWIDCGLDGFGKRSNRPGSMLPPDATETRWYQYHSQLSHFPSLYDENDLRRAAKAANKPRFDSYIIELLNRAMQWNPAWLSVPQLPYEPNPPKSERAKSKKRPLIQTVIRKLNKWAVDAACQWNQENANHSLRLILPIILSGSRVLNSKSARNPIIKDAADFAERANLDGIWVVEKSLDDESGSSTNSSDRFPNLIKFHEELLYAFTKPSNMLIIAGPYWALQLILHARGLATHCAVSVGSGYQYSLSGGSGGPPTARVAISGLKQRFKAESLNSWIVDALRTSTIDAALRQELRSLNKALKAYLTNPQLGKEQIWKTYLSWLNHLSQTPSQGQAFALFRQFTEAYSNAMVLPPVPGHKTAPIAKAFMDHCLSR